MSGLATAEVVLEHACELATLVRSKGTSYLAVMVSGAHQLTPAGYSNE
nr:hypothetical protein [uncultured Undibacterium sp.]